MARLGGPLVASFRLAGIEGTLAESSAMVTRRRGPSAVSTKVISSAARRPSPPLKPRYGAASYRRGRRSFGEHLPDDVGGGLLSAMSASLASGRNFCMLGATKSRVDVVIAHLVVASWGREISLGALEKPGGTRRRGDGV